MNLSYNSSEYSEYISTLKSTGSKAYSLGIWSLTSFWWKLYDSATVTLMESNPFLINSFLIEEPGKPWTVEDDWLPSNKSVPLIVGFPKYPTITALPVFWKPFMNPLVALKEKESVKIIISVGFLFEFFP